MTALPGKDEHRRAAYTVAQLRAQLAAREEEIAKLRVELRQFRAGQLVLFVEAK